MHGYIYSHGGLIALICMAVEI